MLLGAAIIVEVAATLSLRASQDHSAWLIVVVAGYTAAFVLLTLVLRTGLSDRRRVRHLGRAAEQRAPPCSPPRSSVIRSRSPILAGIGLIIAGVLCVELGSRHTDEAAVLMWAALAGAILFEVIATFALRASDGFRKRIWIVPVTIGYIVSFVLLWLTLEAGHAGRHRVRHLDRVRCRAGRGGSQVAVPRTADLADGLRHRADHRGCADYRDGWRRGLSATASRITATPAAGTTRSPTRRLVASAIRPTTGAEVMLPTRISHVTTVSPDPARIPGS